jgi:hypothetical protein
LGEEREAGAHCGFAHTPLARDDYQALLEHHQV